MTLQQVREKKQLTQTDLARRTGLTNIQISNLETGKNMPHQRTMDKIERVLGEKIDWYKTKTKGLYNISFLEETPEEAVTRDIYRFVKTGRTRAQRLERFEYLRLMIRNIEKQLAKQAPPVEQELKQAKVLGMKRNQF